MNRMRGQEQAPKIQPPERPTVAPVLPPGSGAFERLHDSQTFKIYRAERGLRWYTAVTPSGRVIGVAATLWGARRLIRRDIGKRARPAWWRDALVEERRP